MPLFRRALRLGLAAACLLPTTALAAEAEGNEAVWTFLRMLGYSPTINGVLGVLGFVALFLFFHSLLVTRRALIAPESFHRQILDDIASGDIEGAQRRAERQRSLLARTVLPGLRLYDHPHERIETAMEAAGRRALGSLRQRITYMNNIGVLCPMIGLLGTVLGLMKAFLIMQQEERVVARSMLMGGAIGEAMSTTAVGLMIGIPAMAFYFVCMSRLARARDEIEIGAEEVAAALAEGRR